MISRAKRIATYGLLTVSLFCGISEAASAQTPLRGRVADSETNQAIAQAWVYALGPEGDTVYRALTNSEGQFLLDLDPAKDRYELVVEALGYSASVPRRFRPGDDLDVFEIRLSPRPIETEGLIVEVRRESSALHRIGFYERQRFHRGAFIDPEQLATFSAPNVADAFRRESGVRVTESGEVYSPRTVGLGGPCLPSVVLDGAVVRSGGASVRVDPRSITGLRRIVPNARAVAAMEFYRGSASLPPEFGGLNAACGVLVIWTKR